MSTLTGQYNNDNSTNENDLHFMNYTTSRSRIEPFPVQTARLSLPPRLSSSKLIKLSSFLAQYDPLPFSLLSILFGSIPKCLFILKNITISHYSPPSVPYAVICTREIMQRHQDLGAVNCLERVSRPWRCIYLHTYT